MIVTLAGHVDHGKTAIVKALTGVDTDRLADEQARGLTIDLGFAYSDVDGQRIGFVDVPGHHNFIHNMIAGVAHMQHALLVIAADDGVMPQTKEHLQILRLLGISQGTVALNKVDSVNSTALQKTVQEIRKLIQPTFLCDAPIFEISAKTGFGMDGLRNSLVVSAAQLRQPTEPRAFRMAIDRVFSRQGLGTVVTGTIHDGELSESEEVYVSSVAKRVRVRQLVTNGLPGNIARTGDRCGALLSGVGANDIARGDWLRDPNTTASSRAFTLQFEFTDEFSKKIKNWCHVHVYHGTAHRLGRLYHVANNEQSGTSTIVDIAVDEPLHISVRDRVIVRDQSLETTMGGGFVIAVGAPSTRRRLPSRVQYLQTLSSVVEKNDPGRALLFASKFTCVNGDTFRNLWNLTSDQFTALVDRETMQQVNNRFLNKTKLQSVQEQLTTTLDAYHKAHPTAFGLSIPQLTKKLALDTELVRFVLTHGRNKGIFRTQAGQYATMNRATVQIAYNKQMYERLLPLIAIPQPYPVGDLARETKIPLRTIENELKRMRKAKLFVQVSDKRYFTEDRLQELAKLASVLSQSGSFTVKAFRDQSGMGRMACIEVLEYFDKLQFTRREADHRRVIGTFKP